MRSIFALTLLISLNANAGRVYPMPVRIGVIDTGFVAVSNKNHLCKSGHKDFTIDQKFVNGVPLDHNGHGTNVVGLIEQYAGNSNYCIVILKYYSERQSGVKNLESSVKAIQFANAANLDLINFSAGGTAPDLEEKKEVINFLNRGKKIFAAAGNDGKELDGFLYSYYPAMYDPRITVVGNLQKYGFRAPSSNYGKKVNAWENGTNRTGYGLTMTGTSQATAVKTGKYVREMESCDK